VRRFRRFLFVAALSSAFFGCSKKPPPPEEAAALAPVPPPPSLLATLMFAAPNVSWAKMQKSGGGALGLLPMSVGGLLGTLGHMEPELASEIDGAVPAYGVVAGDVESPRFALAFHVVELRRARGILLDGDTARYTAKEVDGLTHLVPQGGVQPAFAAALSRDGYFVIAKTSADITELGPYVTRTLPKGAPPSHAVSIEIPKSALGGALSQRLDAAWRKGRTEISEADANARKAHQGRAPDFGDPQAILSALDGVVERALSLFGDLARVNLSADLDDDRFTLTIELLPLEGDGPAATLVKELPEGDVAPLFDLPDTASMVFLLRSKPEQNASDGIEKALLSILGTRVSPADGERLHHALVGFSQGRDEMVRGALFASSQQSGLYIQTHAKDGEALLRSAKGVAELAGASPFKDIVRVKSVSIGPVDAPPLGKMSQAVIVGAGGEKPAWSMGWGLSNGEFHWFAAESMPAFVSAVRGAPTLRAQTNFVRDVSALAKKPSFVMAVQPSHIRFVRVPGELPPTIVSWGKEGGAAVLRVSLPHAVAKELGRHAL